MIRAVLLSVLVMLVLVNTVAAAPVPRALIIIATLEGDWLIESELMNNVTQTQGSSDHNLWRVSKDSFTLITEDSQRPDHEYQGLLFTEPPSYDQPGIFDYTLYCNGFHRCGVYELNGDTLQIAFSSDPKVRPSKLTSDDNCTLYTFKRMK
jgi:hypothetical protein